MNRLANSAFIIAVTGAVTGIANAADPLCNLDGAAAVKKAFWTRIADSSASPDAKAFAVRLESADAPTDWRLLEDATRQPDANIATIAAERLQWHPKWNVSAPQLASIQKLPPWQQVWLNKKIREMRKSGSSFEDVQKYMKTFVESDVARERAISHLPSRRITDPTYRPERRFLSPSGESYDFVAIRNGLEDADSAVRQAAEDALPVLTAFEQSILNPTIKVTPQGRAAMAQLALAFRNGARRNQQNQFADALRLIEQRMQRPGDILPISELERIVPGYREILRPPGAPVAPVRTAVAPAAPPSSAVAPPSFETRIQRVLGDPAVELARRDNSGLLGLGYKLVPDRPGVTTYKAGSSTIEFPYVAGNELLPQFSPEEVAKLDRAIRGGGSYSHPGVAQAASRVAPGAVAAPIVPAKPATPVPAPVAATVTPPPAVPAIVWPKPPAEGVALRRWEELDDLIGPVDGALNPLNGKEFDRLAQFVVDANPSVAERAGLALRFSEKSGLNTLVASGRKLEGWERVLLHRRADQLRVAGADPEMLRSFVQQFSGASDSDAAVRVAENFVGPRTIVPPLRPFATRSNAAHPPTHVFGRPRAEPYPRLTSNDRLNRLRGGDRTTRLEAAQALYTQTQSGRPDYRSLRAALDDPDNAVRTVAQRALPPMEPRYRAVFAGRPISPYHQVVASQVIADMRSLGRSENKIIEFLTELASRASGNGSHSVSTWVRSFALDYID